MGNWFPKIVRIWSRFGIQFATLVLAVTLFSGCAQLSSRTGSGSIPVERELSAKQREQLDVQFGLTRIVERKGKLDEARKSYLEIISIDPNHSSALHRLGVIAAGQEDLEAAIGYLESAATLEPESNELLGDLGYTYLLMGEYSSAEEYLSRAFEISPNDVRITNNLALVVGYQGDLNEALALFRRCNPESHALANVGYLMSQIGEVERAREYFHAALDIDPTVRQAADGLIEVDKAIKAVAAAGDRPDIGQGISVSR